MLPMDASARSAEASHSPLANWSFDSFLRALKARPRLSTQSQPRVVAALATAPKARDTASSLLRAPHGLQEPRLRSWPCLSGLLSPWAEEAPFPSLCHPPWQADVLGLELESLAMKRGLGVCAHLANSILQGVRLSSTQIVYRKALTLP